MRRRNRNSVFIFMRIAQFFLTDREERGGHEEGGDRHRYINGQVDGDEKKPTAGQVEEQKFSHV